MKERHELREDGPALRHSRMAGELFGGYGLPWPGLPP